jgi:hypothetical protein
MGGALVRRKALVIIWTLQDGLDRRLLGYRKVPARDLTFQDALRRTLTNMHYAANHLPRLRHYLEDGRIEIDNNQIENKIRPLALGRKNYLFAGSRKGAERAAMMYSFLSTCKEHEVNPGEWLKDVLLRINDHPIINKIAKLLPSEWKKKRTGQEEE